MKFAVNWANLAKHFAGGLAAVAAVSVLSLWVFPSLAPAVNLLAVLTGFSVSVAMQRRWPTWTVNSGDEQ